MPWLVLRTAVLQIMRIIFVEHFCTLFTQRPMKTLYFTFNSFYILGAPHMTSPHNKKTLQRFSFKKKKKKAEKMTMI